MVASTLVYYLPREEVWATFPRQDDAMKYAKEHKDVHVFSYQDHVKGQRRFLVSTYKEFWQRFFFLSIVISNICLIITFLSLPLNFLICARH